MQLESLYLQYSAFPLSTLVLVCDFAADQVGAAMEWVLVALIYKGQECLNRIWYPPPPR